MAAVRIARDPIASDLAAEVPPQQWDTLMEERRRFCTQYLPKDCRNLLFFVEDGAANNWLGYGEPAAYIRRGLGLQPEMVDWAIAGLRQLSGNRPIGFETAAFIGKLTVQQASQQAAQDAVDGRLPAAGDPKGGRPSNLGEKTRQGLPDGTTAARRVARLQRDHPDIVARLAAGEFRSVAEAVRYAAGETRGLTKLRRAWEAADPDERATFRDEIE